MRFKLALGLTFVYMLAEAAGGWLTNSLALIADAGHMMHQDQPEELARVLEDFVTRSANLARSASDHGS